MRYRSISVFCLGGWSPLLPTGFHVSRGTPDSQSCHSSFAYRAVTVFGGTFQYSSAKFVALLPGPLPR